MIRALADRLGPRLRYLGVVVVGFGVDLGVTLALAESIGAPLLVSASTGFVTALVLNYLLFEFWVFAGERSRLSWSRLGATLASAAIALAARLAVIEVARRAIGEDGLIRTTGLVLVGAGVSMVVNYLVVSRAFAWSRRRDQM